MAKKTSKKQDAGSAAPKKAKAAPKRSASKAGAGKAGVAKKKGAAKAGKAAGSSKKTASKATTAKSAKKSTSSAPTKKSEPESAARKNKADQGKPERPANAAKSARATPKTSKKKPADATAKASGPKGSETAPAREPDATGTKPAAKSGRKGITVVTPKPAKKPRPKPSGAAVPALSGSILGMGLGTGRPLIPSGPASESPTAREQQENGDHKAKSPYTKRQLEKFREILLTKRRELLGDIDSMENEALKSQSGSLSHLPQHMAEQGSETYEQSLSLDLAAADRVLIREIDAALERIAERTYGLCEMTGKPISKERLAELPWARYSIEAAREMERRTS